MSQPKVPMEDDRAWQDQMHQRILQGNPIAFSELSKRVLPYLVSYLQAIFYQQEESVCATVAIDLLLEYRSKPEKYDPEKLPLISYLKMASRGDMLNQIEKQQRRSKRLLSIDNPLVKFRLWDRNNIQEAEEMDEWLLQYTDLTREEIIESLLSQLDSSDKQILLLMMEGVRKSDRFAEVMQITHLDKDSQRREVLRAKNRIMKKVRRFGDKVRRNA